MNSTQPQRKSDKIVHRDGFVGLSKDYLNHRDPNFPANLVGHCYGMPRLLEEQLMPWTSHIQYAVVEVRRYNSMFAFTSMGGKVDDTVNYGRGPFCYRIHGKNYHRVGSLLHGTSKTPKFAQLYIFDTDNEISNRIKAVSKESCTSLKDKKLNHELATELRDMLDSVNLLVKKFRMAERENEFSMMLNGRRLFQQFLVDGYTMIEAERMSFNRKHQKDLRSETYSKLAKLAEDPEPGVQLRGKKWFFCHHLQEAQDQPDVMTRVFKMMLDSLMKDLKERHIFGRVKGVVYTIEFQKRGHPHCHILLWLEPEDKITTTAKIDKYISAEIPNKNEDPELYQIVTDHMMHGPCSADNSSCPCTIDIKCTKKFPKSIKYLFKYINKGPDRVTAAVDGEEVDEIKDFYDCRYLSACEAAWRIYRFDIHYRTPPVEWLPFHLQDEQSVKGPKEWSELKKYDNVVYPTYRDACYARGLLQDDKEYIDGLLESSQWGMGDYLRSFFVMLLMTDSMSRPEFVWEKNGMLWWRMWKMLSASSKISLLSDIQKKNICLTYIEHMLLCNNKSLKNILNMPYPNNEYTMEGYNRLIYDETSYKKDELRKQHQTMYGSLTSEQKGIYSNVMDAIDKNTGGMFFVYGYGGTGKTYLYKTMSAALRSQGDIVLNVASSGIATLLLEGGRTAHSRFAIPINILEDSMCHIPADSDLADLIRQAKLIYLGLTEPSQPSNQVFGGKVVLFGGDFRQILPAESTIVFPDEMLIPESDDYVGSIIDQTYPQLVQNLWNSTFFQERAILAPTHEVVDMINECMMGLIPWDETLYESSDSVSLVDYDINFDESIYTTDFLNATSVKDGNKCNRSENHLGRKCRQNLRNSTCGQNPPNHLIKFLAAKLFCLGDFRQILPVIPNASRNDVVHATINSSYLWKKCTVLNLTVNMRLGTGKTDSEKKEIEDFANWILNIGNGNIDSKNEGESTIVFLDEMLIP
ncbi:ATP-dependent DNA helicase PIF1-like protein [Tanacetum coccineum]